MVLYCGATEFRSAMKKTNAAPMEMYPTKNRKNVISPRTSSLYSTDGSIISSALTVPAIARDIVAINSRLVVLEKRSNDIIFKRYPRACKYKGEFFFTNLNQSVLTTYARKYPV